MTYKTQQGKDLFKSESMQLYGSSPKIPVERDEVKDKEANSAYVVKTLYNHAGGLLTRHTQWSEFRDVTAEEQRLKELAKPFAIVHRLSPVDTKDARTWVTHSIEVQSPKLRKMLDKIFSGYPQWYSDTSPYVVCPPFKPFVHRWDRILKVLQNQLEGPENELYLLRHVLEEQLMMNFCALEKAKATKVISFDLLWLILAPGCRVVSSENGSICVYLLVEINLVPEKRDKPAHWFLKLAQVDWNGSYSGVHGIGTRINKFQESKVITDLDIYPLEFAPNQKDIEKLAMDRGRKFESLRGFHVKNCAGKKYVMEYNPALCRRERVEKPVSGRIIIDAFAYHKVQNQVPPTLTRCPDTSDITQLIRGVLGSQPPATVSSSDFELEDDNVNGSYEDDNLSGFDEDSETSEADEDDEPDTSVRDSSLGTVKTLEHSAQGGDKELEEKSGRKEDLRPLNNFMRILTAPMVKGFDLKTKEWCEFNVDDIQDTKWDETPYKNLVLPEGEKELIVAFADNPRLNKQGFDDFVPQKGKGIIILLCGPPGVGKTLTAEAVAEKSRAPLYSLGADDLGIEANRVDSSLNKAMESCRLWNAVLLVDEADVFMEARKPDNLSRNELVSVFLRRLEYYQGLMILTTNRLSVIDDAFKSRLDLVLPYYDLDKQSRKGVWKNFIDRLGKNRVNISERDIDQLADSELNGREIKNTIKTAVILAGHGKVLRLEHLNTVLTVRKRVEEFERYTGGARATTRSG